MLPEQARFQLWNPAFYLQSLLSEPQRYSRFLLFEQRVVLGPRPGVWVALLGLPLSMLVLLARVRHRDRGWRLGIGDWKGQSAICNLQSAIFGADRLMLLALPILALLLALLINLKFYNYIVLLLPFIALDLALLAVVLWRAAGAWRPWGRAARMALGGLLVLALLEGVAGVWRSLGSAAATTSYTEYTARVAAVMPPGARVLALHQFWFGVYARDYIYRSMALAFYLSDSRFYQPASMPMDQTLKQIEPEY